MTYKHKYNDQLFSSSFFMSLQRKKEILKGIDLLSFFHESTLERLAQESKEISLEVGKVVFEEGDPGKTMFIVLEGEIVIEKNGKNLATMHPGTFFGEMSLIESRPRTAGARALSPSLLMEIDETQFQEYFAVQPQALMAIMKTLSARSRKISTNLISSRVPTPEPSTQETETPGEPYENHPREVFIFETENYKFLHVNSHFCLEIGFPPEKVGKMSFLDLAPHLHDESLRLRLAPLIDKVRASVTFETVFRRQDESTFPVECRFQIVGKSNSQWHIQVGVQDITERKQMEHTIRQMAYYDSLTGLPNRNLLNDRLAVALAHAVRNHEQVGIMFLDLDNFKTINDSLGHGAGDQLLQQVARRLKDMFREEDTVARMGGDEFVVLVPGIQRVGDIAKLAQKIIDTMGPHFKIGDNELYIGCSIGISIFPHDGTEIKTLLKNSDLAMYRAKENGRNTFQLYTASMNSQAMERMAVERNLRKALEREEFELFYQPKINLKTGEISGVEALIRWESPELGMVMPNQFIAVAEETRLIIQLGYWIMETACKQAQTWLEQHGMRVPIAINLSVVQFTHPYMLSEIKKVLENSGTDPSLLEIEITESMLMHDTHMAISILQKMSDLGIKIAIDDFGTGYSSLNYLKNLPIDYLKIDRTFISDLDTQTNVAIAKTIVALAQSLNLTTIAEGVETEEQKDFLKSLDCDEAQGYLFSKPLPKGKATDFLKDYISGR